MSLPWLLRPPEMKNGFALPCSRTNEELMKLFFSIVVLSFSAFVFADGPTTIHGLNEAGEEIRADVEVSYEDEPVRTSSHPQFDPWSVVVSDGKKEKREFKQQYCGFSGYGSSWSFSCAKEGNSPLAGTTYAFRESLDNCGGFLFVCTRGCSRHAPRELINDLWECQEAIEEAERQEERSKECSKKDRQGTNITVKADKVNLRDAPSGKVLRTLSEGTKAKFISGDGVCITIAGKSGQWIEVNITDKQTVEGGWLFDAYVDYHNNP